MRLGINGGTRLVGTPHFSSLATLVCNRFFISWASFTLLYTTWVWSRVEMPSADLGGRVWGGGGHGTDLGWL